MKKITGCYSIIFAVLTLFFIAAKSASAAFGISANPYEGGFDLRFGKIDPAMGRVNKEVRVEVTTDIDKQYRVIQVLQEPLTNSQGDKFPQNSFLVYAVPGTNKYGTLSVEMEIPVYMGRKVIYTSNQQGLSDSFALVYSLLVPVDQQPGSYRGRLLFTLEPIGATESPATVILGILAEVEVESRVRITTVSGGRIAQLKPFPPEKRQFDVGVDVLGGMGRQFEITQFLSAPLISPEGNTLDLDSVSVVVRDGHKGRALTEPVPLSLHHQTLYTSGPRGEADSFVVTYGLGDLSGQKAGKYRGKIKYLLEGIQITNPLIDTLDLEIDNPEVLELAVTPEIGKGFLRFDNLKPQEPPRISEVNIEIRSNIGKPYQVSQNITSLFTSKEGKTIPKEYFILKTEAAQIKGKLNYADKTDVRLGEMTLFVSDDRGSSDKFKVIYELSIPPDLKAGDYSTRITYSITAI